MRTLKLYWLGPARIELAGRTVKAETRKSVALLAYLSLLDEPCSRELLATLFWPEADQQKALGSLRRTLFSLNSRLPGWVNADHQAVSLRRNDKLFVDVDAFHRCLAAAREHSHPPAEPCERCLTALTTAAAYYRGDFLEALNLNDCPNFDQWQFIERDGLRQDRGQALQRLTAIQAARGQSDEAILTARRWLAMDRLHEPACRTLMDLYAGSGQRTAALREFEDLTALLKDEQPELETRELYHRIQAPESAKNAAPQAEQPASLPLLKTKLYIPTAPVSGVVRSALLARLTEAEHRTLTLLSAPAGFGKTTLLAQWVAQSPLPVAWLSLDAGDNDPYRFLEYVIAALRGIDEELGSDAQQILRSPKLIPPHIILASLLNDLGRIVKPYVVVFDDCQFIVEHGVYEILGYLIDHLPGNMHLVIATRSDPPVPLGRLRAHGRMLELRAQDFRFTDDEAARFLNVFMRLGLSNEDVQALEARTEGWVVGLKMAALSLKGHQNASEFVRAFSGSHRYVLDYLMEEVLKSQPAHIRTFLLETSFLEKLSGPSCDALMTADWKGCGTSAQEVLEYLETSNLFIVPLDENKLWYRYHHLFAELLRSQLLRLSPARVAALHRAACRWFESNGLAEDAVLHATNGGDYAHAARLIEQNTPRFLSRNEFSLYLERLNAIPHEISDGRPWLSIGKAWANARLGKTEDVEHLLQQAEAAMQLCPQDRSVDEMAGYIAVIRANVANLRGDPEGGIKQTVRAQTLLPEKDLWALDNMGFQRGLAYLAEGDLPRAEQEWTEAAARAMETQDFDTYANAAAELGSMRKIQGVLHRAYDAYYDAYCWLEQQGSSIHLGCLEIGMADILLEWNKLDDARRWLAKGVERARAGGRPNTQCFGDYVGARLSLALDQPQAAEAAIVDAEEVLGRHTLYPRAAAQIDLGRLALWIRQGEAESIGAWLRAQQHEDTYLGNFQHELSNIARARALVCIGAFDDALALLDRLAAVAENGGRRGWLIEVLVLKAMALQRLQKEEASLASLSRALQLAQPEEYVRLFLDEGQPMIQLLSALLGMSLYAEQATYVKSLLAAGTTPEEKRA
jgi:ATP/maltotriose-dependent transcriptional regulator MalT/DNA-binding SARP family transcriptional activator